MFNRKVESKESELDRALRDEEDSAGAAWLKAMRQEAEPRAAFVHQLENRLRQTAHAQPPARLRLPRFTSGIKPLLLASASLLLVIVLGGVLWLNQPESVSAEQVLQRAAAARLTPNAVMHLVYKMEQDNNRPPTSGTGDVWVQADVSGSIIRTAMTFTGLNADGSTQSIQQIVIDSQQGQQYDYDPRGNTVHVQTGTADHMKANNPNYFDGASVAQYLNRVAQGGLHGMRLLPAQSFLGVPVHAVETDSDGGMTFYFDAQTYILRGAQGNGQRIRLTQSQTLTAANLPPDAFAFNPPAGARVVQDDTSHDYSAPGFRLSHEQLAAICHVPPAALDAAATAGKTALAACQQGDPTMTTDKLAAALLAPYQRKLDAAAAAGNLTSAQASEQLANLRIKLTQWATMPLSR